VDCDGCIIGCVIIDTGGGVTVLPTTSVFVAPVDSGEEPVVIEAVVDDDDLLAFAATS
jgi:hypothetical protein